MPRQKTKTQFAIKLIHPQFGDYYFSYFGWNNTMHNYVFVHDLSKVTKWKTTKFVEKQIDDIIDKLKRKRGRIMLSFGDNVDESIKKNMILSKKKYYYPITTIKKLDVINNLKEQIKISEDGFEKTAIDFLNSIRDLKTDLFFNSSNHNQQTIQDFIDDNHINDIELLVNNSTTFLSNIKNYINSQKLLEKSQNYQGTYLDIVDASYNFRGLKLKNLNILNNEEESDY